MDAIGPLDLPLQIALPVFLLSALYIEEVADPIAECQIQLPRLITTMPTFFTDLK
jgi:hypothetical protein